MEACAVFPDDILVEILSRLPAKSVHRFKCVSKPWRDLISDRNHRKRLPQTLAGFFYRSASWDNNRFCTTERHFYNLSGCRPPLVNPVLAFLPNHADIHVLDCCNGLLLYDRKSTSSPRHYDYFVCNPATEKWVALPDLGDDDEFFPDPFCLAFDPAVSSHFHVFLYKEGMNLTAQVRIYSSRTGRWIIRDLSLNRWICLSEPRSTVFFNGLLHFLTYQGMVVTMDLEAKEWKEIELPDAGGSFFLLGQSQGCLWYVAKDEDENKISFWTLEDGAWSFNHSFPGSDYEDPVAFHPDCNTFFFTMGLENRLMSYDIDRGKACCLFFLGSGDFDWFLPYVPCFSDTLADED